MTETIEKIHRHALRQLYHEHTLLPAEYGSSDRESSRPAIMLFPLI